MPPLKFLTLNTCTSISGLTNKRLPSLVSAGGLLFGPPLLIFLTTCTYLYQSSRPPFPFPNLPHDPPAPILNTVKLALSFYLPLSVLVGFMLGVHGGRLLGLLQHLRSGNPFDYKAERLRETVSHCKDYDVVMVQEIYKGYPFILDPDYPNLLHTEMKKVGFQHAAFAAPPQFPSVCMGTGLLILSKHPILSHSTLSFENQFLLESFGVNRGAMHARIQVPDQEEPLDVFTCHLSPSMREALMKDWPEALLAMGDRTRAGQFAEMKSFVERQRSSSTSMCVVGGDFNANIKHLEGGGVEEGIAYPAVKKAMVDGLGFEDAGWRVTYGYVPKDKVLTNPNHPDWCQVTEDLVFVDPATTSILEFDNVPLLASKAGRKAGYTHLSDHQGLGITVEPVRKRKGKASASSPRSRSRSRGPRKK